MGSDGIAISPDGARLSYCPLGSRKFYSVDTDALVNRSLDEQQVAATVADEGDRGGASDGLESDAAGYIYSTNYEHNAILRRHPDGKWDTVTHDPRLLSPDTLSLAADDISMLRPTNCIARRVTRKGATCAASHTHSSASASTPSLSYCGDTMFRNTNYNSRTL